MQRSIMKVLVKGIKAVHTPEVQSAAVIASSKLMLTSVIHDNDLLEHLVVCYFDPATKENAGVRQALSYFLPVFCHSRQANMERMASVAAAVMHTIAELNDELEEDLEMVGLSVIGNMLVDWTDPRKLVTQDQGVLSYDESEKKNRDLIGEDIHLNLAETLLETAMGHGCSSKVSTDRLTCTSY